MPLKVNEIQALSELQTALASATNIAYFVTKAQGLALMNRIMGAFAFAASSPSVDEEESQVRETQRIEGIRLWFGVLDCINTDAAGVRIFNVSVAIDDSAHATSGAWRVHFVRECLTWRM